MNFLKYITITLISLFLFINNSYAWNIDLTISPIKYEIEADKWETVTRIAKLINRWNTSYDIITWKSDFESKDNSWNPLFVKASELAKQGQALSNWIEVKTDRFTIWPWEEIDIKFDINIPEDATPGWHYWAVFFKNNNSSQWEWAKINVNVDYWVLVLVKVKGEIITKLNIDDTLIINPYKQLYEEINKDSCFWGMDLTNSNYDWKCISWFFLWDEEKNIELTVADDEEKDFEIKFDTLFSNLWNTHIKPYGKITLIDENGKQIKRIWKEIIKNDAWAITWEKIVDYLPINDNWWNILPWTDRLFSTNWKWFPYEGYDENWKIVIKYWNPEMYYTQKNINQTQILMPWQRVAEKINNKKITANISIEYLNKDNEIVEFNSAQELYVNYKEKYIWINPYIFIYSIIVLLSLVLIIYILFIIFRKKKKKCNHCWKKIEEDMKICPYCGKKQKNIQKK